MSFHPLTIVTPTWKTFQKIHLTSAQSVLSLRRIKWSTFGHQVDNTARFWGSYHSLSLQINENRGFNIPLNAPFLGKYTFVSFLPWSVAVRRSVREYWAGSKIGTNPNSYIAFFSTTIHHYKLIAITRNVYEKVDWQYHWISSAYSFLLLPNFSKCVWEDVEATLSLNKVHFWCCWCSVGISLR